MGRGTLTAQSAADRSEKPLQAFQRKKTRFNFTCPFDCLLILTLTIMAGFP